MVKPILQSASGSITPVPATNESTSGVSQTSDLAWSQRLDAFKTALDDDRGGAAIEFLIALPIFLMIVAILVQYALIVNAREMVDYAAAAAGRSAVTSLPEDHPENVQTAACIALATLSPKATADIPADAATIYQALQSTGAAVPESFPARYAYATQATTTSWTTPGNDNIDYTTSKGVPLTLTLVYRFYLTVPGARTLIGEGDTVAGVGGRFLNLTSTVTVQTSHSRKTASDASGWPE